MIAIAWILARIARHVSEAALIRMVAEYEDTGEQLGVWQGLKLGTSRTAWRLFLIDLTIDVPVTLTSLLLFALAAHERGYRVIPLGANMPLGDIGKVARLKKCQAIVLSGAIEPSEQVLTRDLPALVEECDAPVLIGGLSSVYSCDAINRAGAEALGRDIEHGIQRRERGAFSQVGQRLDRRDAQARVAAAAPAHAEAAVVLETQPLDEHLQVLGGIDVAGAQREGGADREGSHGQVPGVR